MTDASDPAEELRALAREHPEDFRSVAEKVGGATEERMKDMLADEGIDGRRR